MSTKEKIKDAYLDLVLKQGQRPASVFSFMKEIQKEEAEFYKHFSSFESLEKGVMQGIFEQSIAALDADEEVQDYGTREKLLALYYTWLGQLLEHRSFVVFLQNQTLFIPHIYAPYLHKVEPLFFDFVKEIIYDGIENKEVADRFLITQWYKNSLWAKAKYILAFWGKDQSDNFEKTDLLIEKAVNFVVDCIQPNALDSGWDLTKFLWKNR